MCFPGVWTHLDVKSHVQATPLITLSLAWMPLVYCTIPLTTVAPLQSPAHTHCHYSLISELWPSNSIIKMVTQKSVMPIRNHTGNRCTHYTHSPTLTVHVSFGLHGPRLRNMKPIPWTLFPTLGNWSPISCMHRRMRTHTCTHTTHTVRSIFPDRSSLFSSHLWSSGQ